MSPGSASAELEKYASAITDACALIDASTSEPDLATIAKTSGLSPAHFHRIFTALVGVTPKAYAGAIRRQRTQRYLTESRSVTEAMYKAGFHSSGRFYERSAKDLGMTPKNFKNGGKSETIRFAIAECSLGPVIVAATAKGVCCVMFDDDPQSLVEELQRRFPRAELIGADSAFEKTVATVLAAVERPSLPVTLPLDLRGTAFQQKVWQALRTIPAGGTATYLDIAKHIGLPKAVRAVAQACGANNISVLVPCHRVVRTDGSLSGYRWGVERKAVLLQREKRL